jgi:hypothetical protein
MVRPTGERRKNDFNCLATNETKENIEEIQCSVNHSVSRDTLISDAAEWLSVHRSECSEPITCFVEARFGLTKMDAVKALQRAHALRYARAM